MKKSSMNEEVCGNIAVPPALAELLWVPSRERAAEILTNAKAAYTRGFTREAISRARQSYDFQPMDFWRYLKDLADYAKVNLVDWCAGYKIQVDCEVDPASAKTLASMLRAIRLTRKQASEVLRFTLAQNLGHNVEAVIAPRDARALGDACLRNVLDAESSYNESQRARLTAVLEAVAEVYSGRVDSEGSE